jgi:diguanylate cyclase (GGDEF)-like protein/PAS domain S-box-containing protein
MSRTLGQNSQHTTDRPGRAAEIAKEPRSGTAPDIMAIAFESQEGRMITDAGKVFLKINKAFTRITGYGAEDVAGMTPHILSSGLHDAAFFSTMTERLEEDGVWQGEIWNRRKNGEVYPQWLGITAVKSDAGHVTHYLGTLTDISERKSIENELRNLAFYDPLTRLPNRRLLLDRLQQAMTAQARSGKAGAVLLLDLDNFKALNDSLGHDVGDQVLVEVARRIESAVRQGDTVARMGGDEFVVMLEGLDTGGLAAAQAESVAMKIHATLDRPHLLKCHKSLGKSKTRQKAIKYRCTSSVGIAMFSGDHDSIAALLKKADLAMYQSKAIGRNSVSFFDTSIQDAFAARTALYAEIQEAIRSDQFIIHYHPMADGNGGLMEVEALIRWQHPQRGLLQPAEFIPFAEQNRQIIALDHWVLTRACRQLAAWAISPQKARLCVTVNISPLTFTQKDFVKLVLNDLKKSGANPQLLRLEFTEKLMLDDVSNAIAKMEALSEAGVSFSLDDFGTGDSSLTYLMRLPLHQLKISRSLVNDMSTNAQAASLVYTVIALAKSLGLTVIAKGAETQAQQALLSDQQCDAYQSYLFCEPMALPEFEVFLDKHCLNRAATERVPSAL